MARSFSNVGIPVDETPKIRDGISRRESDCFAFGSKLAVPPENKDRADAGDLSMTVITDFEVKDVAPFKNLRSK